MKQSDPGQRIGESEKHQPTLAERSVADALHNAGVGVAVTDEAGVVLFGNPVLHEVLGCSDLAGRHYSAFGVEDTKSAQRQLLASLEIRQRPRSSLRRLDGSQFAAHVTVTDRDTAPGLVIIVADVSELDLIEDLAHSLLQVAERASDLVALINLDTGSIRYANPAFLAFTGLVTDGWFVPEKFLSGASAWLFESEVLPRLREGRRWQGSLEVLTPSSLRWVDVDLIADRSDSRTEMVSCIARDVTQERHRLLELQARASFDALTGLPNRTELLEIMQRQSEAGTSFAICHFDLDRFNSLNLGHGHAVGDRVLIETANRLRNSVRGGDTIARIAGDEFVVLMTQTNDCASAVQTAERLRSIISDRAFDVAPTPIEVTTSVGVAVASAMASEEGEPRRASVSHAEQQLRDADAALYRAKISGRNRVEAYDRPLRAEIATRDLLVEELRQGLAEQQFGVVYQPIVALETGQIRSVEALVRWFRPDGQFVGPDLFIPLAETVGLAGDIDRFVLATAATDIANVNARRVAEGQSSISLHTNLSATQLSNQRLVSEVTTCIETAGLPAHLLCLELTETALAEDPDTAASLLAGVSRQGIEIAVDDFGTGYSSLEHLHHFAIDVLKIDRAFVQPLDAASHGRDTAIVRSVLSLANELGLAVVAEGVETEEQRQLLISLGCTQAQGYYFSRPVPLEDLTKLVLTDQSILRSSDR